MSIPVGLTVSWVPRALLVVIVHGGRYGESTGEIVGASDVKHPRAMSKGQVDRKVEIEQVQQ